MVLHAYNAGARGGVLSAVEFTDIEADHPPRLFTFGGYINSAPVPDPYESGDVKVIPLNIRLRALRDGTSVELDEESTVLFQSAGEATATIRYRFVKGQSLRPWRKSPVTKTRALRVSVPLVPFKKAWLAKLEQHGDSSGYAHRLGLNET